MLSRDRADLHAGVHLAVAGAAAEVFTATHLLDVDLVAHLLGDHFRGDACAGHAGLADLDTAFARNEQHVVKRHGIAGIGPLAEIDLNLVPCWTLYCFPSAAIMAYIVGL